MKLHSFFVFLSIACTLLSCDPKPAPSDKPRAADAPETNAGLETLFNVRITDVVDTPLSGVLVTRGANADPYELGSTGAAGTLLSEEVESGDVVTFSKPGYVTVQMKLVSVSKINKLEIILESANWPGSTNLYAKGTVYNPSGGGIDSLTVSNGAPSNPVSTLTTATGSFFLPFNSPGPSMLHYGSGTETRAKLELLQPTNDTVRVSVHLSEKDDPPSTGKPSGQE